MAKAKRNGNGNGHGEVVSFSTAPAVARRRISIDGEVFEVRNPGDLRVIDSMRAKQIGSRFNATMAGERADEEVERQIDEDLVAMLRLIVPSAPEPTLRALPDAEKMRLVAFFSEAAKSEASAPPTTTSSPASSGSTGGDLPIGS